MTPIKENKHRSNIVKEESLLDGLNTMSYQEIQNVIRGILAGTRVMVGNRDEIPSLVLANIFHKLNPDIRQIFLDVLLDFLSNLAHDDNSIWRNDSGDELLLAVGDVFYDVTRTRNPTDLLLYILERRWDLMEIGGNLHWRSAQTLIDLNYRASAHFWIDLNKRGGAEYSNLTFAGLTLLSLSDAFDWMIGEIRNASVYDAFKARLPLLIEENGKDALFIYLVKVYENLPGSLIKDFLQLLTAENIQISPGIFDGLELKELFELGRELEIDVTNYMGRSEIIYEIGRALRKYSKSYFSYTFRNPDIEIISNICDYMECRAMTLSQEFRNHLFNYGMRVISSYNLGEDGLLFESQLVQIQQMGIDITRELQAIGRLGNGPK